MTIDEIQLKGEELARKYNPEGFSPFPFDKIEEDCGDLSIFLTEKLDSDTSGALFYSEEERSYNIFINKCKPETRIYFTIAHEMGHYFLHKEIIIEENFIVDGENSLDGQAVLYRLDAAEQNKIEKEANNFAAALIMPEQFVRKVWGKLQNVQECANVFKVSVSAMSIRLERLRLL